jgi:hypothetical protein
LVQALRFCFDGQVQGRIDEVVGFGSGFVVALRFVLGFDVLSRVVLLRRESRVLRFEHKYDTMRYDRDRSPGARRSGLRLGVHG